MRRPRVRSALLAATVLATGVPALALATSPALHCGVPQSGSWETLRVDPFKPVASLTSPDSISAYAVDEDKPQDIAVTNGVRVQTSSDHGCDWSDSLALSAAPTASQPFPGLNAKVVSLALLGATHVAAVQEGSGAASRPHVLVGSGSTWAAGDNGLPLQGAPKLLRAANDGRTLYLTISPTNTGGDSGSTSGLPGLPLTGGGAVGGGSATGFLYASTDRGRTWALRTAASDLPSGGEGFTALDVDASDPSRLYGIVDGQLAVSKDGGGTFTRPLGGGFTAVTAMGPLGVGAFTASGRFYLSTNGGASFTPVPGPAGVTSAAYRSGDAALMIERSGVLQRFTPYTSLVDAPAASRPRTGSLLGDRNDQASFHAVSGHSLLRYVDAVTTTTGIPPVATGDTSVPPPNPGRVVPAAQAVTLPVGSAATLPFTLDLPKNPTPLDLYFLVDASGSMRDYIDSLKANIRRIVGALEAQRIDLKVGVGTLGSGEKEGSQPYPLVYVYPTKPKQPYHRPTIYHRIRAVGDTGPDLQKAINQVTIESDDVPSPPNDPDARGHEGQLLALQDLSDGQGIKAELGGVPVAAGQDARWRPSQAPRRIVVMATDEAFDAPYPQRRTASGGLDFGPALRALNDRRTQVIGLSAGSPDSVRDLQKVAAGTHSFAPPGGVDCGLDPNTDEEQVLAPGDPLVCSNGDRFADTIIRLLNSLVDRQTVKLVPLTQSKVLGSTLGSALTGLDVKKPNAAPFSVNVSCVDVKPGRYGADVAAVLRGTKVGQAHVQVTCVEAAAAVPPKPVPPVAGNPPAPPAPQPVAPAAVLAPPAPAVQPQVQPQVQAQVQVNPMSAGAMQEQQELQLALALNGTLKDDDPAFSAGTQMAMVDRRKREQVQALYVLATAMTACAGLGLARLRSRPSPSVRRAS